MNPKTTIWLIGMALVLGAYIYLVDLPAERTAARLAQPAKLLPAFEPSKVTGLEISRSNQIVRAELRNSQWQLANPVYPAQATAVESFLETLKGLNRETEIAAQEIISESGGLSPFGLDPPWATVRIQTETNVIQLRVGAKTLVGDRVYVQPAGAAGIFLTDGALVQHLPASINQWRNPLLLQPGGLIFDRIAIGGATSLKLERDSRSQLWRLADPITSRADFGRVEYLIQQLRSTRVSRFVSDDPNEDLERFGLQVPEAELTLACGSNTVFRIQFGKSPTNDPTQVYVRRLSHTNVVLIPRELVDLVKRPYAEFQDRTLISFRPGLVDRIEARAEEAFAVQRHGTNDWRIVEPFPALADRQLMQLFLEDLGKLEIVRFEKDVVADFSPYGLATPARQYVLKSGLTNAAGPTNQTLVQVDFGAQPTNEIDKIYCRRTDESSLYVVSYGDMLRLARGAWGLRDRHLWRFASSNVMGIHVTQRGRKRAWERDPVTKAWSKADSVNHAAIEETLHRLGEVQIDDWVARGEDQAKLLKADGTEYQLALDVAESGKTRRLTLNLRLGSRGQPYGSTVLEQDQPVVFRFPTALYALVLQYLSIPLEPAEP
jgi:hypothetical protein